MLKNIKTLAAILSLASILVIVIMQGSASHSAVAQDPNPTPTPTPKPGEEPPTAFASCCELMNPGGKTIGGPAISHTLLSEPDNSKTVYFAFARDRFICATVTNLNAPAPFRQHEIFVSLVDSGGVFLEAGHTRTICGRTNEVKVDCSGAGALGCTEARYRWRIDLIE